MIAGTLVIVVVVAVAAVAVAAAEHYMGVSYRYGCLIQGF